VVIQRGEIYWANLPEPTGSEPGYRRPVLVIQSDDFNRSRIATAIVVVITSNLKLAEAPGNVLLPKKATGLSKDSVANISQVLTVDKRFLTEKIGDLPIHLIFALEVAFVLPQQAERAESVSQGAGSPDTSFFYSSTDLYNMAETYGAEGRTAYVCARFTFDLIFPLTYLFFLATSISWVILSRCPRCKQPLAVAEYFSHFWRVIRLP